MSGARTSVALMLAVLFLASSVSVVWAHANFVRSDPPSDAVLETAPDRLQLWFSEPVEPGFSEVQVLDASRRRVDRGDSHVAPDDAASMVVSVAPLERGTYTVAWSVLSTVDGHVTRGVYSLNVGVEPPAQTAASLPPEASAELPYEAGIRWLGYLSAAALVGTLLFRLLVLDPTARRLGLAGAVLPAVERRWRRLLWTAFGALGGATVAALALQVVVTRGSQELTVGAVLGELVFSTRWGVVWLARLGLVLAFGGVLFWLPRHDQRRAARIGVAVGGGVLLTYSLNSHGAALSELAAVAVAADWLHLAAVSLWVGGLFSLVLVLPGALRPLAPTDRSRFLAHLIPRFSALAIASVGTLLATGVYQAWVHVGSFGALLETLYGKSLLTKLGLAAPLLLLGAGNLLIIRPRLAAAVASVGYRSQEPPAPSARGARLSGTFWRLVSAEAILATLVLLATGVLTSSSPARQTFEQIQATRPLVMNAQARNLNLALTVSPPRAGPSTYTVLIRDGAGRPVDDAERVDLRFSYLDEALGTSIATAEPQGDGRYVARGSFIGFDGRWQVELLVRQPGQDDARAAFRLGVTATSAAEEPAGPGAGPISQLPSLNVQLLLAAGLALLGAALFVYVARTVGVRSLEGGVLALASVAVVGLGIFLVARVQPVGAVVPDDIRALQNPYPPTEESLAIGQDIYRAQCQTCHGVNGRGDGPLASTLNPRPADFRVHMAAGHTDGELFSWLSNGVEGTGMPAFRDQLSEEERWHAINFIKTFAPSDG
ncbi:MAG: c-type cytochrome [Chloroflexi bacterium]|nr:c-type cytochrome [Chloroflexota bacterium]